MHVGTLSLDLLAKVIHRFPQGGTICGQFSLSGLYILWFGVCFCKFACCSACRHKLRGISRFLDRKSAGAELVETSRNGIAVGRKTLGSSKYLNLRGNIGESSFVVVDELLGTQKCVNAETCTEFCLLPGWKDVI